MIFTTAKSYGIIVQHWEDDPHNPGWWRYGRPRYIEVMAPPQISPSTRWTYGSAATAEQTQQAWDIAYGSSEA